MLKSYSQAQHIEFILRPESNVKANTHTIRLDIVSIVTIDFIICYI